MVSVTAKLRYLRITPRKVRQVSDLIRGKTVEEAQTILRYTVKKAAQPLLKLLKSAVASAKNNFQLEELNLYISKILVDEGPKLKRWRARARGRADEIQKKTSHVTIVLDEITKKPKKVKKIKEIKKVPLKPLERIPKIEKPKFKPEIELPRPKIEKGIKRVFRRKAF
ncbi:MAG: 50S ribosomal protein L22 [Candidatus Nealsonbacteria bacterium CG01_land_8_20_14_3_00_12]|uniref:Large ribosomal subunit protein uL22 n=4 Tax=Candidatus Nealsoniibacteriota TaxID=1817911 RepID=A0A2M7EBF5_9BACT|nr:MAG: 50S ribosomal protein L22 [Candidatus Nealsonbacteria bacterium CG01_land_8_20_14_3_00_12]PIW35070.1 MAG: 50S ribosomal protein L22 [Candidatus Nealsonbacteria bacterium CG15_BIG_FIL_POST_REV_8_21_14_020_37_12]